MQQSKHNLESAKSSKEAPLSFPHSSSYLTLRSRKKTNMRCVRLAKWQGATMEGASLGSSNLSLFMFSYLLILSFKKIITVETQGKGTQVHPLRGWYIKNTLAHNRGQVMLLHKASQKQTL